MRAWYFLLKSSLLFKKHIIVSLVFILIISAGNNFKPYIIKLIVDDAGNFHSGKFLLLSLLYLLIEFLMISSHLVKDWAQSDYELKYCSYVTNLYMNNLTQHPLKFYEENSVGGIISKINSIFYVAPLIVNNTMDWIISLIIMSCMSIFVLFKTNILVGFISLCWFSIFFLFIILRYKKATIFFNNFYSIRPKIFEYLSNYLNNITSVWFFSNSKYESEKLNSLIDLYAKNGKIFYKFLRKNFLVQGMFTSIYMAVLFTILYYDNQEISPGDVSLIFVLSHRITDMLFASSHQLRELSINLGIAGNSISILEPIKSVQNEIGARDIVISKGDIRFNNVNFKYNDNKILFDNKSIHIRPQEKVGLVGYSGSGKSSFVNLILRLYDVNAGEVILDGYNVKEFTLESLRRSISFVQQETNLFNVSIAENIHYGNLNASYDDVINAAKKAHAHEFIINLPEKYETIVGEKGLRLSGGQKQRISIARAILKNSPILILDEATSALDSVTELLIRDAIDNLTENKTTIIIAHRLSTLKNMNRILVFDKGKIIEEGSHKELIEKQGLYYNMWQLQSNGLLPYKEEK